MPLAQQRVCTAHRTGPRVGCVPVLGQGLRSCSACTSSGPRRGAASTVPAPQGRVMEGTKQPVRQNKTGGGGLAPGTPSAGSKAEGHGLQVTAPVSPIK